LNKRFDQYLDDEFKSLISNEEKIPTSAIRFSNLKEEILGPAMMKDLYPNGEVFYRALHIPEVLSEQVCNIAPNYIDEDSRKRASRIYPFSVFATDAMVAMLLETNRLNQVDENIYDINRGLQFERSKQEDIPYK